MRDRQGSRLSLFRTRRYLPLFVAQALGAFNDNVFRNALVILVTYRLAGGEGRDPATLVALAILHAQAINIFGAAFQGGPLTQHHHHFPPNLFR